MFKRSRSILILVFLLAMVVTALSVGAVVAQDDSGYTDPCVGTDAVATAEATEVPDNSNISFEIILPNARGDRSFIDSAAAGAERAIAELGVKGTIIETAGTAEHDSAIRRAVQDKPDLIITIAVDATTVQEIAEEFPEQKFAAQET